MHKLQKQRRYNKYILAESTRNPESIPPVDTQRRLTSIRRLTTLPTSYRRLIDAETPSCVYWARGGRSLEEGNPRLFSLLQKPMLLIFFWFLHFSHGYILPIMSDSFKAPRKINILTISQALVSYRYNSQIF